MLMRTDPFRGLERWAQQGDGQSGTRARPAAMPMDAYRAGDEYVVHFDLPGVGAESIDVHVERNVLTVTAERASARKDGVEYQVSERPHGVFSRQLFLGEALDTENIAAGYDAGVLTLRIPVIPKAQPRKIDISARGKQHSDAGAAS